jgi:hypothetical protein
MLHVRALLCLAIVSTSNLAAAQIADPWAQNPPPSEPAAPSTPAPSEPATPPTPSHTSQLIDPWQKPMPATLAMRRQGDWIAHPAPVMRPRVLREPRLSLPASVEESAPPRRYPFEVVDRPLVLPPGVTELGVSYQRRTFVNTTPDQYGYVMPGRTSSSTPDFDLAHAFSRAELGIGIGQLVYGWVSLDTQGVPERMQFSASGAVPQPDGRYGYVQRLSATHKLWVEPRRAALVASGMVQAEEFRTYGENRSLVTGELIAAGVSLALRVQPAQKFALSFGGSTLTPLATSLPFELHSVFSGSAGALIAFDTWDITVDGALANLSADVVTFVSFGFRKRWGL